MDSYLVRALAVLEARVNMLVATRRKVDDDPGDQFRGLYVSDDHVDRLLATPLAAFDLETLEEQNALFSDLDAQLTRLGVPEARAGEASRFAGIAERFGLDGLDASLLVVALAPDIDSRYERLYGYLNDDVTRRRASVSLALELCGASPLDASSRSRLLGGSRLVSGGLLVVEDLDRPFLTRSLRVPDRVAAHLLGDDHTDPGIADLEDAPILVDVGATEELEAVIEGGVGLAYVRERPGCATRPFVASAFAAAGLGVLSLALERLERSSDPAEVAALAAREALLSNRGLLAGPVEILESLGAEAVRCFTRQRAPVVLFGKLPWDPRWSARVPYQVDAPDVPSEVRDAIVEEGLSGVPGASGIEPGRVLGQFRLSPEQIARAVRDAGVRAMAAGRDVSHEDLQAGARAQNSGGLERLARRIVPAVGWDDLVLPPQVLRQLHELASRAEHRHAVIGGWGMRRGGGRGRGVVALFAGESGTGKTMSAEVIARELGIDLYTVNLATVVDKYVGETEKNLERIFTEADGINGVLLFDEADALFGKRSEVSDAHDRYANIEVAYLLQRIESFDGLAVLATNLRSNVDEAFTRRLDAVIDFPVPEEPERLALWDACLGTRLPRAGDIDLAFMARSFKLAGGAIRNIALTAAYFAADRGDAVNMVDLVVATQREYRKLGRLCLEAEFGPYHKLVGAK